MQRIQPAFGQSCSSELTASGLLEASILGPGHSPAASCSPARGSLPGPLVHTLNATQVRVRATTHKAHTYISQFNIRCGKQVHPSIMQSYKDTLGIGKRLGTKTTEKDQAA